MNAGQFQSAAQQPPVAPEEAPAPVAESRGVESDESAKTAVHKLVPVISAAKPPVPTAGPELDGPQVGADDSAFAPALGGSEWNGRANGAVLGNTAAAASVASVESRAVGLAAPMPPAGGPGPYADDSPTVIVRKHPDWRPRKQRSVPRLDIGQHQATERDLDLMQLTGTSFGFLLGRNQAGFPVTLTLFRPDPVSVALVGASWAARLLAYRALRHGAKVLVFTDQPAGWSNLGRVATGRGDRVAVLEPGSEAGVVASPDAPVLSLYDGESPPSPAEPAPWLTRVMVLHQFTPHRATALRSDVVLLQRLMPYEASVIAASRGFTSRTAGQLQALRHDMLAVLTKSENHYVWLSTADEEREELGPPGRY
ncbi:hypothetical protein MOQ72_42355 [Saccharopolyspora sp. K220]|uniref:hypothetical protein n=1 Tax=Saccharopolyspora soli TaxID=2926618 RepID=UPI001F567938|nr:hypothetical protein [Saccharopolyspora soli]MCI2424061.1 hypothetical protein [Saccharopolyspora soli]